MPDRELDDIARKMPSDRGSSTGSGADLGTADDGGAGEEYSEQAAEAISDLTSTDESERLDASYSLDLDDESLLEEVEEGLQQKLEDDDPEVRAAAARSLGEVGSRDSVDPLRDASKDKVRAVSNAATEALRQLVNSDGRRRLETEDASPDTARETSTSAEPDTPPETGEADEEGPGEDPSGGSYGDHAEPDTSTEEAVKGSVHGGSSVGSEETDSPERREGDRVGSSETEEGEKGRGGVLEVGDRLRVSDAVVLRLAESGNAGVADLVESSLRSAVESYPEAAEQEVDRYLDMLSDDRAAVRRYGSSYLSVASDVDASLVEDGVDEVVKALDDGDDVVRERAEKVLENVAQESPETLTEMVVEAKKSD